MWKLCFRNDRNMQFSSALCRKTEHFHFYQYYDWFCRIYLYMKYATILGHIFFTTFILRIDALQWLENFVWYINSVYYGDYLLHQQLIYRILCYITYIGSIAYERGFLNRSNVPLYEISTCTNFGTICGHLFLNCNNAAFVKILTTAIFLRNRIPKKIQTLWKYYQLKAPEISTHVNL